MTELCERECTGCPVGGTLCRQFAYLLDPKWIPVEKELPEEDGEYLVSAKPILGNNSPSYIDVAYFTTDLYGIDEHDFYNKKGVPGFYKYGSEWGIYKVNPIAWQPLPEPYKEEEK